MHLRASRTARVVVAMAVLSLLHSIAAARPNDPTVPSDAASLVAFPVRLLPSIDRGAARRIDAVSFLEPLDDSWFVFRSSAGNGKFLHREPGRDVRTNDSGVRIRAGATLLRIVVLPASARPRLTVQLSGVASGRPGEIARYARLLPLGRAAPSLSIDKLSGETLVSTPFGPSRLNQRLTELLHQVEGDGIGRWVASDGAGTTDGATVVQASHLPVDSPTLWAIAFQAGDERLDVREFQLDADFVRFTELTQFLPDDAGLLEARVAGDVRPALAVPARGSRPIAVPGTRSSPTDLRFGLLLGMGDDPLAVEGDGEFSLTYHVGDQEVELARGVISRVAGVMPSFAEWKVAWPAELSSGGYLRFENDSDFTLVVGQPILQGPVETKRPNLLVVSLDTLRADHLGCYGYDRPTSPFLDALAARGGRFIDCSAAAPFTLPSHATLLTGLFPPRHRAIDDTTRLDTDAIPYLPKILASAGYRTAAFVGGGYVSEDFGFHVGFDRFQGADPMRPLSGVGATQHESRLRDASLNDVAEWIEECDGAPWFVWLHTYAIHDYFAPKEIFEQFDRGADASLRRDLMAIPGPTLDLPDGDATDANAQYLVDLYDATIRYADGELEHLFERLEKSDRLEETYVVIVSDHGEEFREHGRWGHTVTLYREMLHVPFIVIGPDVVPSAIREPVHHADVMPTLLDLVGVTSAAPTDGVSRATALRSGKVTSGEIASTLYAQVETPTSRRASIRVGPFKLILGDDTDAVRFPVRAAIELYDLRTDPGEHVNLAPVEKQRASQLEATLAELERRLRATAYVATPSELTDAVRERLRQLGYLRGG